ncbi:MAG: MBL fold metallo-hydrolase [Verrucomicrobiales bacterium]|nr:MBL fold metallo-hydrolase [Verrucomicrobiales bacterium]
MIRPLQSDEQLLADIQSVPADSPHLHYWWLGQSGFLVKWKDRFLLLDPYLSDSLTLKYASTDKPHVRMTERVIAPERLTFVNWVTSSHNHTDHLDRETLLGIRNASPDVRLVLPEANRAFATERLGTPADWPIGLTAGASFGDDVFRFHGIPSAHNTLETDELGRHRFMGFVIEAGPWRLYHSGDTLRYPGMEQWLTPWKVDLAFLPINGDRPERRVAGNLDGREAAELARDIGARCVVPCHYELFEFNTASPDLFVATCQAIGQPFQVLRAGEQGRLHAQGK